MRVGGQKQRSDRPRSTNIVDYGCDLQEAIDMPRGLHYGALSTEDSMPADVAGSLQKLGTRPALARRSVAPGDLDRLGQGHADRGSDPPQGRAARWDTDTSGHHPHIVMARGRDARTLRISAFGAAPLARFEVSPTK